MNFRQFLGVICAKTCIKAAFQVLIGEPHLEASNGGYRSSIPRENQVNSRIPQNLLVLSRIPYDVYSILISYALFYEKVAFKKLVMDWPKP